MIRWLDTGRSCETATNVILRVMMTACVLKIVVFSTQLSHVQVLYEHTPQRHLVNCNAESRSEGVIQRFSAVRCIELSPFAKDMD